MAQRRDFLKYNLLSTGLGLMPGFLKAESAVRRGMPDVAGNIGVVESSRLSRRLKLVDRNTAWKLVRTIAVRFKTFHCQGMVKIGTDFWVSSVELKLTAGGVVDRSSGVGHLFKISGEGDLLMDIRLAEGPVFHPSGIDFDGRHIWVAVAEYRPDSSAIVYRFNPADQSLEEVFHWADHIGGISRNPERNSLHGISWGSRKFYRWELDESGRPRGHLSTPAELAVKNPSFYIDYQDNQYLGGQEMLYTGLNTYKISPESRFSLGGLEIIDLDRQLAVHQVPVQLWSPVSGAPMTQNPSFFELTADGRLLAYFMPDDNESTIYIYEVG